MKKTFMIFAIIALLVANVSTARAEENFGFSIAGVEVSDENCDEIGKVLRWSNFLLSGDVTYNQLSPNSAISQNTTFSEALRKQ